MAIQWIDDPQLAWESKRIFVRVDWNVPLDERGTIVDDSRIQAVIPTLRFLMEQGAKLVVASHLGRPNGKPRPGLSMEKPAERLQALLNQDVVVAQDCVGDGLRRLSNEIPKGGILVIENLRFHSGEEKNDSVFAKQLAVLADAYVNDAFGVCHRAHASVAALPALMPTCAGGFLIRQELESLKRLRVQPAHPYVVILGGNKVADKLLLVKNLIERVDRILIGGAMAYTFLKAKGENVGQSPVEMEQLVSVRSILLRAEQRGVAVVLPVDHVVATSLERNAPTRVVAANGFLPNEIGLDIGPQTQALFTSLIANQGTLFWNGPLGMFSQEAYTKGTKAVLQKVCESQAYRVVGGGDSALALHQLGLADRVSYVSTGGGASLAFVEGRHLPGLSGIGYDG